MSDYEPLIIPGRILTHQDVLDLRKRIEAMDAPAFDADVFSSGLEISAFCIRNGYVKFLDFAHKMLSDVGNCIRPFLKSLYSGVRYCPGLEAFREQMSSADFVDLVDPEGIKQDNKFYLRTWRFAFGLWYACEFIQKGFCSLESLTERMVADMGESVRPEIAGCYEQARDWFRHEGRNDILQRMDPPAHP